MRNPNLSQHELARLERNRLARESGLLPVLCGPILQKLPKWFLRALNALLRVAAAVLTTALLVGAAILIGVGLGALAGGSYSLGVVLAVAHSWAARKSIGWSCLAGCLSWVYVVFYVVMYMLEKPEKIAAKKDR